MNGVYNNLTDTINLYMNRLVRKRKIIIHWKYTIVNKVYKET